METTLLVQDPSVVGSYFNANWEDYTKSVRSNILCHEKMFSMLATFLSKNFANGFSMIDCGCGDGSAILQTLLKQPVKRYMGIDAAHDLMVSAHDVMANLPCEKHFICDDMTVAITQLTEPVDLIFSSYAIHHLSRKQKFEFIKNCQHLLTENGFFIMVDGIRNLHENREDWLSHLEQRFIKTRGNASAEEIATFMQHPRDADFPEDLAFFQDIASEQKWKNFSVLVNDDNFLVFTVFSK